MTFREAVEYCEDMDVKLLPYELADMDAMENTRQILSGIRKGQSVAVFIGPEGGFEESEADLAIRNDFETITLGHRILRTETAGLTILSWLILMLE
jgi:16S rRNA (uracil1498-N3)-methyltransferase